MAEHVLGAIAPLVVAVVCDDPEVAAWALEHGALLLEEPGLGLNGAVTAGVDALAAAGADEVLVVHADLPLASGLARSRRPSTGVTLVPDRREDGTNVACVPANAGFRFCYGPRSFVRHCAEAARLDLDLRVVRDQVLAWDVDVPADIPAGLGARPRAAELTCSDPNSTSDSVCDRTQAAACRSEISLSKTRRADCRPRDPRRSHLQSERTPTTSSSAAVRRSPSGPRRDAAYITSSSPTARKEPGTPRRTSTS